MNFILVMSAAINPNGMPDISAESLLGREDQYIRTLQFYNKLACIPRILFVENSNWDLTRLKREIGSSDKIEYLSLDGNTYPRAWGKGYGEFQLLDRAVDMLTKTKGVGIMVKVTGRFPILNISTMIKEFSRRENLQLSVDVIDHPLYDWLHLGWSGHGCRTIIYAVSLDFYMRHLYGHYPEIHGCEGGLWGAESLMRKVWGETKMLPGVYSRFKHEPLLSGFAGAVNHVWITANNYDSLLARIKRLVRQLIRYVMPWLWI